MTLATTTSARPTRVLAVASAGGHWQQLMSLRGAMRDCDLMFATTLSGLPEEHGASPAVIIPDCNRADFWRMPWCALVLAYWLVRFRPHVLISTGALPGVMALFLGKLMRAKTVWIDSVANAEEMSMSGRMVRHTADLWLSQWPHVAKASGARYAGAIL
ncbi:glycosyltransferase family protein [Roseivivax sediminis]|uniref:Oligosaccharide biosynthesis protein Alg14 like n=1 Tax=Roseivivax sediminis TaxID=936889 RepID=A0A1I2DDN3_9RHOB|nr:UDP-N-acetylglucosamine--LPS N-acetylglucosamine transferase [Roseivivax sediminis]SFE78617.1 Oligosaccharide biosynthesis protein Alg14 like [Roseivivax sediminis]